MYSAIKYTVINTNNIASTLEKISARPLPVI